MSLNDEQDFDPSPKLLPFGGFEVAVLLTRLHDKNYANERNDNDNSVMLLPVTNSVRSGYLRSKMLAG